MANIIQVLVPDIGNFKDVEIIEVMVKVGDTVSAEESLITLETDKATMDVPSPISGVVKELKIKLGDKISEGALIALIEVSGEATASTVEPTTSVAPPVSAPIAEPKPVAAAATPAPAPTMSPVLNNPSTPAGKAHASPSIRRFARELGVNLAQVKGSGEKGRVTKEDVQNFVKAVLAQPRGTGGSGLQVAEMPVMDFSKFGPVQSKPLSRIKKLSGAFLHRNWVLIPHITQFDEADITDMEAFRKQLGTEYAAQGLKITPLVFLLKAVVEALQRFPDFNASLDASGENLILKNYFHIGVAVDTPDGLVVPVLRDVNQKGIVQLAKELADLSARAREKKISAAEMQGGCFTISSLGGIGGTAFTPIINAPEVAILGVSRSSMKPVWKEGKFEPRLMLPLSLSYDHRVIDGRESVSFLVKVKELVEEPAKMLTEGLDPIKLLLDL